jgi:hypothetical protein
MWAAPHSEGGNSSFVGKLRLFLNCKWQFYFRNCIRGILYIRIDVLINPEASAILIVV